VQVRDPGGASDYRIMNDIGSSSPRPRAALYVYGTPTDPYGQLQLRGLREASARQNWVVAAEYVDWSPSRGAAEMQLPQSYAIHRLRCPTALRRPPPNPPPLISAQFELGSRREECKDHGATAVP
jgi:hypothetical protein